MKKTKQCCRISTFSVFLSVFFITGVTHAASVDTKQPSIPQVKVSNVKVPVQTVVPVQPEANQPKVKLNDNTVKAINNPKLPSAATVPEKKIKPAVVPKVVTQPKVKPAIATSAPKVTTPKVSTPKVPTAVAVAKPRIDNIQLQQIQRIQDAAIQAATVKQLDELLQGAATLPEVPKDNPLAGTAFDGVGGPAVGDRIDAEKLIREAFVGQGPTLGEAQDMVGGWHDEPGLGRTDDPTGSPGPGGLNGGGKASAGHTWSGNHVDTVYWPSANGGRSQSRTEYYDNGSQINILEENNGTGTLWEREHTDSEGRVYKRVEGYDEGANGEVDPGDTRHETITEEDGTVRERDCEGGECGEWVETTPGDSQPTEGGTSGWVNNPCNYNPVTRKCQGNTKATREEMTGQPSPSGEGDDGPGPSSPNAGITAVINPDDFQLRGTQTRVQHNQQEGDPPIEIDSALDALD